MTTDLSETIHKPHPLSEWITGTLTIHFPGAVVSRPMTLAETQTFHRINNADRASDRLEWHHLAWFQWNETKVLASTYEPDEDLGWGLSPEDRAALEKKGYHRGVPGALHDHWKAKRIEPSYSAYPMGHLHDAAITLSAEDFELLADRLEGEEGSRFIRTVADRAASRTGGKDGRPGAPVVDDDASKPEPTPNAAGSDEQESAAAEPSPGQPAEADANPDEREE